jgi:hypothetical protein
MTNAALPFAAWRDELAVELAEAQQALAAAASAVQQAEFAHLTAQDQHAAIQRAVATLHGSVSHALSAHIRGVDEERYTAASAVARARADFAGIRDRIADLQQAAQELAFLLMAPAAVEEQDHAA